MWLQTVLTGPGNYTSHRPHPYETHRDRIPILTMTNPSSNNQAEGINHRIATAGCSCSQLTQVLAKAGPLQQESLPQAIQVPATIPKKASLTGRLSSRRRSDRLSERQQSATHEGSGRRRNYEETQAENDGRCLQACVGWHGPRNRHTAACQADRQG